MTMKPLLGAEGRQAVAALMRGRPLLAFDFDGTLAPIVARPDDARIPLPVARRLAQLARRWPVAVVTGRAVADVRDRLGFEPRHVVGNHGIEDPSREAPAHWVGALDPLRRRLNQRRAELDALGIRAEDKRFSLALHYRLAHDEARARAMIDELLQSPDPGLSVEGGKCVVNVMAEGAPDKGDTVLALVERSGADAALFIGDDDNDESVFRKARPGWVTVRMGPDLARTEAAYYLDGPSQMPALLQMLLDAAGATFGRA